MFFVSQDFCIYFSDVLFISFANLIIRFVQYSVFKVREVIDFVNNFGNHFVIIS